MQALGFAHAAQLLGAMTRMRGLKMPAFRSPPSDGLNRSVRHYPGGSVVSVRLRDRDDEAVLADMVAGVLAVNGLPAEDPLGTILLSGLTEEPCAKSS